MSPRPAPAGRKGSWHLIEASTTAIAASTLQGARTESPECTHPAARAAKAQAEPGQGAELAAGGSDWPLQRVNRVGLDTAQAPGGRWGA